MVLPPGAAQCVELLLAFGKEVLGSLQVAVQDVHAVLERFEADPLPYAAQFGGGFAMLFFGQFAAVGRSGLAGHRDAVLREAADDWGRRNIPTVHYSGSGERDIGSYGPTTES